MCCSKTCTCAKLAYIAVIIPVGIRALDAKYRDDACVVCCSQTYICAKLVYILYFTTSIFPVSRGIGCFIEMMLVWCAVLKPVPTGAKHVPIAQNLILKVVGELDDKYRDDAFVMCYSQTCFCAKRVPILFPVSKGIGR